MLEVVRFSEAYHSAWFDYVGRSDKSTIAHDLRWQKVITSTLGHRPRYLLAVDGSRVRGILPLFVVTTWWRTRYVVSLPWIDYGGVCADDPNVEKVLLDEACRITREEGAEFMELRSPIAGAYGLTVRTDKVTFLMPLDPDPDRIWGTFGAKLRNQIRKSEKAGLTTELGGTGLLADFYKVFARNMRDLGTPVWGKDFFAAILRAFPEAARIILVNSHSGPVAAGLVLSFKDRLYVPSASSYRRSLYMCPNHALYWRVIKEACREGKSYFDFGRSSRESNTFRFKKQWVPDHTQLNWQYFLNRTTRTPEINPNNPKYRLFVRAWQKLPMALANFLGPKVIKNFP